VECRPVGSIKYLSYTKRLDQTAYLHQSHAVNAERETPIKVQQVKYSKNVVEQDHRAIKRRTRPMLGFKDFDCARVILTASKSCT
jgi:transposase-like protein